MFVIPTKRCRIHDPCENSCVEHGAQTGLQNPLVRRPEGLREGYRLLFP